MANEIVSLHMTLKEILKEEIPPAKRMDVLLWALETGDIIIRSRK